MRYAHGEESFKFLESQGWKYDCNDIFMHLGGEYRENLRADALWLEIVKLRQALKEIAVESAPYMGCCDAGCTLHEVNEMALTALGVDVSQVYNHEEAAAAVIV